MEKFKKKLVDISGISAAAEIVIIVIILALFACGIIADDGVILLIMAAVIAVIAVIPSLASDKKHKQVKQRLRELEAEGQLNAIYDDFASGEPIYSRKLRLALSHHYLLDVGAMEPALRVIPLSEIERVYLYKMIEGQPTVTNFIALENAEHRYIVAQSPKKTQEFDLVLKQLKTDVEKENLLR